MGKFFWDVNKFLADETTTITKMYHATIRELVKRRFVESGVVWGRFVFGSSYELITERDFEQIEANVLSSGYRFDASAVVSVKEAPEKYRPLKGQDQTKVEVVAGGGRSLVGQGDNVTKQLENVSGTARYVHTVDDVVVLLEKGIPPNTIAVIDDAGGTLTAPILEGFKAIVCLGGTVRSHLGILSREYGIPCLMNARISGIEDGDKLELEVSNAAKSPQDFQNLDKRLTSIWKIR